MEEISPFRSLGYSSTMTRMQTGMVNMTPTPRWFMKSMKDRESLKASPIMMFGGSPMSVAVPPILLNMAYIKVGRS